MPPESPQETRALTGSRDSEIHGHGHGHGHGQTVAAVAAGRENVGRSDKGLLLFLRRHFFRSFGFG